MKMSTKFLPREFTNFFLIVAIYIPMLLSGLKKCTTLIVQHDEKTEWI